MSRERQCIALQVRCAMKVPVQYYRSIPPSLLPPIPPSTRTGVPCYLMVYVHSHKIIPRRFSTAVFLSRTAKFCTRLLCSRFQRPHPFSFLFVCLLFRQLRYFENVDHLSPIFFGCKTREKKHPTPFPPRVRARNGPLDHVFKNPGSISQTQRGNLDFIGKKIERYIVFFR